MNAELRLMNELLQRYKNRQSLRAVSSPSEAVNVTLSMKLVQIIELVSKKYETTLETSFVNKFSGLIERQTELKLKTLLANSVLKFSLYVNVLVLALIH